MSEPPHSDDHRPLRGRTAELAGAIGILQKVLRQGTSGTIVVRGAPGVGTTAFCEAVVEAARARGFVVRAGTGRSERAIRLGAVIAAFPELSTISTTGHRERNDVAPVADDPWQTLARSLTDMAGRQPLLVWLDDAQWLEPVTVSGILLLARRLARQPVVWLLAAEAGRVVGVDEIVDSARRGMAVHEVALPPLSSAAVRAMCVDRRGDEPGDRVSAWLEAAAGNASLVTALLDSAGAFASSREPGRLPAPVVDRVNALVLRWAGDEGVTFLRAGALLGWSFGLDEVGDLLSVPPNDLVVPLRSAVAQGIVVDEGRRIRFRQRLVAVAMYLGLEPSVRELMHRAAVRQLSEAERPLAEIAPHLAAIADVGDERVLAVVARSAEELLGSAPGRAADLVEGGLRVAGDDPGWRLRLARLRVDALLGAGLATAAVDEGRRLLAAHLSGDDAVAVMVAMSQALWLLDRREEAASLVMLASQETAETDRWRAQVRSARALVLTAADDFDASRERASAALEKARGVADPRAESTALCALGHSAARAGRDATAAEHFAGQGAVLGQVSAGEIVARTLLGDFRDSGRLLACAAGEIEDRRSEEQPLRLASIRSLDQLSTGALEEAERESCGVLAANADGEVEDARVIAVAVAATVGISRGDHDTARTLLSTVETPTGRALLGHASALLAHATGDHSAAASCFDTHALDQLAHGNEWNRDWMVDAVRIGVLAGDTGLAEHAAAAARTYAELNPHSVLAAGWALQAEGLVAHDPGLLARSVEALSRSHRPLVIAAAHEDHAHALVEAGASTEAAAPLTGAERIYAACGADAAAGRVRRELRSMGVRVATPATTRAAEGWDALTPAQAKVVLSVAQGRTNQQVADVLALSPNTIAAHLRVAFRKLGVSSRVQLTRVVLGAS